ncbi:uncharacterized protein LOC125473593 [Pyrus x bretschneideri]|uniref:uncharacterized protein LOC125473593 n=1 Tax=Pyrus x bretschneideri TaxID=225117 RepID=UPI00202DF2B5|nr:uncharacterized protein LOC125473593 [Pyrus x bretschneideri]
MTHDNLMNNYCNPNSVYIEEDFRRHFQMRRHIFERLLHDVQHINLYFLQKLDKAGCSGFSPHQKVTPALQMLAYAFPADAMNDTYAVLYKEEYLREPNQEDLDRFLHKAKDRDFPGMIGSLDCMHWQWKNNPIG